MARKKKRGRWRRIRRSQDVAWETESGRREGDSRRDRFGRGVASLFELPEDVILNVPRITIVGSLQMIIENHRGLIEYSPGFIRVGVGDGQMSVEGRDLVVGSVFSEALSIMGQFTTISFDPRPPDGEAP